MNTVSRIAMSISSIGEELLNESNELEEKLAKEENIKAPFKMSDYIKPQDVTEEEKNETEKEASEKKNKNDVSADDKVLAGATATGSGAMLAKHTYDRGNLTGRETLYHNTRKQNVESIKQTGLKGSKALDPDLAFTPDVLQNISKDKLANKVYFGRKKSVAEAVGLTARVHDMNNNKGNHQRETMKAKVPTWKMKEVDNPELLGAKNKSEFRKSFAKSQGFNEDSPLLNPQADKIYKMLGRKGTAVIEGDVAGKYFKGHKGYEKANLKEVGEFIKKNPKRFAKGMGQAVSGAALIGAGGKLINDGLKQKKSEKVAAILLEEAGLVKIASEKDIKTEKIAYAILEEAGLLK